MAAIGDKWVGSNHFRLRLILNRKNVHDHINSADYQILIDTEDRLPLRIAGVV